MFLYPYTKKGNRYETVFVGHPQMQGPKNRFSHKRNTILLFHNCRQRKTIGYNLFFATSEEIKPQPMAQ